MTTRGEGGSVCQFDFDRGTGRPIIASVGISRRLVDIDNHVLSLRELADHVVINHYSKTVLVDMQDTHDAGWVEMVFLGDFLHQVPYSALSKVDGTVVIGLLVSAGKSDVEAGSCDMVSKNRIELLED